MKYCRVITMVSDWRMYFYCMSTPDYWTCMLHVCRHRLDFFMSLQGWEPCKYWKMGKISLIGTLISVIIYFFLGAGGGTFGLF